MAIRKTIISLLLFTLIIPVAVSAEEPVLSNNYYTESFDDFANPERGFHRYTTLRGLQPWAVNSLRSQGQSLILGIVTANDYIDRDFDASFFSELTSGFSVARDAGVKVNFRLYYNDQSYSDPPLSRIISHIDQLQQIFEDNSDVINIVEAGFIGPWGEWHNSNLGNPPTVENMTAVLFELLSVLPEERMVSIRRPMFKRQIFANPAAPDGYDVLNDSNAFDGSNLARTGYHNDAFVTSNTDLGTYVDPGWSRADELAYAGNESQFTPFGGESSWHNPLHELTHCDNSTYELETLHASNLNDGWYGPVLDRWENEGCMDEIKRSLGYRFVLRESNISEEVKPGGILHIIIDIDNIGYAALFNPRHFEIILQNGTEVYSANVNVDARRWKSGSSNTVDRYFRIPADIPEGYYDVKLNLPDPASSLHDNPLYSIQLANTAVWDQGTGYNSLITGLHIHSEAPGSSNSDTIFQEIGQNSVTGRVTGDIRSGVTVRICQSGCHFGCTKNNSITTTTNSDGYFVFSDLPEGWHRLIPEQNGCSFDPSYQLIFVPQTEHISYDFVTSAH